MRFLLSCFVAAVLASAVSAAPVEVTASQAIRIALVDTAARPARGHVERTISPLFAQAVSQIYGGSMQVELVPVGADFAADGLRRGVYDASLVIGKRLPTVIKRAGFHALRAVALENSEQPAAFLVLRHEQPRLDALLANAFSVAVNHDRVRQALAQRGNNVALASNH
ncbi:MAG TPA: hypothetical protein VHF69_02730 [Candidatus Synoicihabitans sp.]|nr:hypothetical protein [Candidatus Synoicihabitans sp.]